MVDVVSKGLAQETAVIKGTPPVTRSRAFALWLALLVLYFLLLPTAADTPDPGAGPAAVSERSASRGPVAPS